MKFHVNDHFKFVQNWWSVTERLKITYSSARGLFVSFNSKLLNILGAKLIKMV